MKIGKMKDLEFFSLEGSSNSPKIELNPVAGTLKIEGISKPENVLEFYAPVTEWVDIYLENPKDDTELHFSFIYFNTSSMKFFLNFLNRFRKLKKTGKKVTVKWQYQEDDSSIQDAGEMLSELTELDFVFESHT